MKPLLLFLQAAFAVLLLTLQASLPASTRFAVLNLTRLKEKVVAENGKATQSLTFELMQYHHVKPPFARPNLTLAQRVKIAVNSSQERSFAFHRRVTGTQSSFARHSAAPGYQTSLSSIQGCYVMQIRLGTPARTLQAIADTGSEVVWVQCSPCKPCFPEANKPFNPRESSTYKLLPCKPKYGGGPLSCQSVGGLCSSAGNSCLYSYPYGDGSSTEGDLALDTITLNSSVAGKAKAFGNFAFGCGTRNSGDFGDTDGLVGLGQGPLSLVEQLGSHFGNVFSYCLVDFYSSNTTSSLLRFGGTFDRGMMYTPMLKNPVISTSYYYVNLLGISVAGKGINYPAGTFSLNSTTGSGGLILDSCTTLSQIASSAYRPFVERLESHIHYPKVNMSSVGLDLCYNLSMVMKPSFPNVVFHFQDQVRLSMPNDNVFIKISENGTVSCLAFQETFFSPSILGNVQQQNFQIVYDRANSLVGFAPKNC